MSDPISYPSLRIILEYLEANKRIHISSRSPTLQRFEKSIPLQLDYLFLGRRTIVINEVTHDIWMEEENDDYEEFETLPDKSELAPGDVLIDSATTYRPAKWNSRGFRKITMMNKKVLRETRIPANVKEHTAIKTMMCSLMGGRKDIRVNRLSFFMHGSGILRLPLNFSVHVRNLESPHNWYRGGFLDIVSPSSVPLKNLKILIVKEDDFNHDILKKTNRLTLAYHAIDIDTWFLPNFARLTHQNIYLDTCRWVDERRLLRIVQHYLTKPRSLGSRLTIQWETRFCKGDLKVVKTHYKGKSVKEPLEGALSLTFKTEFNTSVLVNFVPGCEYYADIHFKIIPNPSKTIPRAVEKV